MSESIPSQQNGAVDGVETRGTAEAFDSVSEAATDAGLDASLLPPAGTEARYRLCTVAKDYSKEVHQEMLGRAHDDSGPTRRSLHNQLCIMLFGVSYEEAGPEKVKRAKNFAHLISGRDQYVEY